MQTIHRILSAMAVAGICLTIPGTAVSQQITGTPGSPSATTTIDGQQLPPPDPNFGGVIKDDALQSTPWWAPRVVPPKDAPNVLLIITDDAGFGVPSTFGGVIPTPTMDRIAKAGLRYNRMCSTALCSPTRAALITGRNHHSVGFGVISEQATGFPGYDSVLGVDNATIGRILLDNGYNTSWFGKDHNTPAFQASQSGPFDQWPTGMGFRILLRVRRRRRQSVAAEPLSQHDANLPVRRQARLELDHRHGGRSDRLDDANASDRSKQAGLHQIRARRFACTAPPDQGMGGQDHQDEAL